MQSEIITAQELTQLKPIECPQRGGVNYPCVVCQECEIGEVTMTFGEGYLVENTVNSILIHLELPVQDDPLEKAVLKILKGQLSEKIPAIQKGDWEAGDLQIMLTDSMVRNPQLINDVGNFINQYPPQFRQFVIAAKRQLTTWSAKQSEQLAHKFFRNSQE